MPWNPNLYNQFKNLRQQPFFDLVSHIHPKPEMTILDLGCGTGELTKLLADKFSASYVLGIDNSAEMLEQAPAQPNLEFANRTIPEQLATGGKWDLIHANASLQWVDNHSRLFPSIIDQLLPGGQIAVQMPSQKENVLNQLLFQLVHEPTFYKALKGDIRHSPLLSMDEYTELLFSNGATEVVLYQKVYPIIAQTTDTLFDFISGSALVPYLEKLEEPIKSELISTFKNRINERFPSSPMVYAFKRLLMVASF